MIKIIKARISCTDFVVKFQPRTQASSRYPSYQRRFGTQCDSPRRTFPTSLTGDVTSEIAEDDWERGWLSSNRNSC